jgi:hypothetical protein
MREFRRNAATDAGTDPGDVAVIVSGSATITGTDGDFDIEGRERPQPVDAWDAGAIELEQQP